MESKDPDACQLSLNILLFAKAREIAGKSQIQVKAPTGCTVKQLVDLVVKQYPTMLAVVKTMVLSVNLEYVAADSDTVLKTSDEVIFAAVDALHSLWSRLYRLHLFLR